MGYTHNELVSLGTEMWREGATVKNTVVDGIFDCTTAGHGGYLVDVVKHPELKEFGCSTSNSMINAFEEDYEALKVIWLYPKLVKNKEWYDNITINNIICYETNNKFKEQFPNKGGIEVNQKKKTEDYSMQRVSKIFFVQLLRQYDFDIYIEKDKYGKNIFKLKDLQGGNLGNIESEEFHNLADIIDRLNVYHEDYIDQPLEERINKGEKIENNDWDLIASRFLKSNKVNVRLKGIYQFNFNDDFNLNIIDKLKEYLDQEEFPLIYCYIEKSKILYDKVPYEILKKYEESLHLYFETDDIVKENDGELYSKSNKEFDSNIIKLAEDVISFEEFCDRVELEVDKGLQEIDIN